VGDPLRRRRWLSSGVIALKMEAVQTSEAVVNSHQSTRRYNPEDSHLHSHRRENLKKSIKKFIADTNLLLQKLWLPYKPL
jgi:hypothetical protein